VRLKSERGNVMGGAGICKGCTSSGSPRLALVCTACRNALIVNERAEDLFDKNPQQSDFCRLCGQKGRNKWCGRCALDCWSEQMHEVNGRTSECWPAQARAWLVVDLRDAINNFTVACFGFASIFVGLALLAPRRLIAVEIFMAVVEVIGGLGSRLWLLRIAPRSYPFAPPMKDNIARWRIAMLRAGVQATNAAGLAGTAELLVADIIQKSLHGESQIVLYWTVFLVWVLIGVALMVRAIGQSQVLTRRYR
jgi:hypothetical protein